MARNTARPTLTPQQAAFVVERALADRKLTGYDVNRYVGEMRSEISDLEERLSRLREAFGKPAPRSRRPARPSRGTRRPSKVAPRSKNRTRKVLASQRIQGQYLGYMRQIPEKEREKYRALAKKDGREKAIVAMKKALGK